MLKIIFVNIYIYILFLSTSINFFYYPYSNLNSRASFKTDHKSLEEEIYKSDEEFIEILNNDDEAKIKYFDRKVKRLQTMQSNLKRKLDEESAVDKRKRENLQNKIEMLEWETEMDKHMIHKMKKKLGKK